MRRLLLLASLLLWAHSACAQSVRYQSQVIGSRGLSLANQNVAVCSQPANTSTQPCSPLATLATSTSTTSGGANPLTTDVNGNFFFYAAPGRYTVQIYGPQVSTAFVQPDTVLACDPTGACTSTGSVVLTPSAGNTISLLNAQANAAAITGNSSAQTVYTYTLPANTVANLKGIRVTVGLSHSTGSAAVTYQVTLNGVSMFSTSPSNAGAAVAVVNVLNTGATTGTFSTPQMFFGGAPTSNTLTGLAWTSSQVLTLTFNVANTDAVTPIQWIVELIQ